MPQTKTDRLRVRGFISVLTALSFLVMAISGIILFIMPQGRIAYWLDWRLLGLTKPQWGDMHITTSLLFILAGVWHTVLNWKALLNYFRNRAKKTFVIKTELALATLMTVFFTVGAVYGVPPLSYVLTLNEMVKESWIEGPEDEPVVSHAEKLPLKSFVKKADLELEPAMAELTRQGIKFSGPDEKLLDIARNNNSSPAAIYKLIKHLEKPASPPPPEAVPAAAPAVAQEPAKTLAAATPQTAPAAKPAMAASPQRWTADTVEAQYEGKGSGRKTLAEVCTENGLDPAAIVQKLASRNITMTPQDTLKTAATTIGEAPMELLKIILTGELRPR